MYPINASLSCIDLGHIEKSMKRINDSKIHALHYDVVDGLFNECFIFGDLMLKVFKRYTKLPITVHLACKNPLPYIKPMIQNGADDIAIHYEADVDIVKTLEYIHALGAKPVLAFRCDSEVPSDFLALASHADRILKLTVHPGFAGQNFHKKSLQHIEAMHSQLSQANISIPIEVDGNINTQTIGACSICVATMFTGGSSGLFLTNTNLNDNINALEKAAYKAIGGNYGDYDEWN